VPQTFLGLQGTNFNALQNILVMKLKKFMVVPTFLYGRDNDTEMANMEFLRSAAGCTFYDHKTNEINNAYSKWNKNQSSTK
jgi:hypothetical protein